jgi:TM2 domain-containing membrane protein YozV
VNDDARPLKRRIVAAVLAFAFGAFGAHRFYLGQRGLAALYLLLSWTLVPGLVAIVDFVRLVAMTDAAFAARHGAVRGGGLVPAAIATAAGLAGWGALVALSLPTVAEGWRAIAILAS